MKRGEAPALRAKLNPVENTVPQCRGVAEWGVAEEPRRPFDVGEDRTRHNPVAPMGGNHDPDDPVPAVHGGEVVPLQTLADKLQSDYNDIMTAQTLGFAVQPEDRAVLDELVEYFGAGNRSAYLRATLKVMKSIMIADQLRESQAYGQQRIAELGIEPAEVPSRVQQFLKGSAQGHKK